MDVALVRRALAALKEADPRFQLFGAIGHRYELAPPAAEDGLRGFERRHGVALPDDYRTFLLELGNGGAGPFYGVLPLGALDSPTGDGQPEPWPEGFVGTLATPWPHAGAWNLDPPEGIDEDASDAWCEWTDGTYWAVEHVHGAVPICHHGCALRDWLVISGPERGSVWHDARADRAGLRPWPIDGTGPRVTFEEWYARWLREAEESVLRRTSRRA